LCQPCNNGIVCETLHKGEYRVAVTVNVEQLGAELKRRRDELGISLRAVEQHAQISAATLSRIERGATPEFAVIERLATWLGVNICAAGEQETEIDTDEDLLRMIVLHVRKKKNVSPQVAQSIARDFEIVMRLQLERAASQGRSRTRNKSLTA
jgi:transcriptional regulator with XRE-family HTH domain